MIDARALHQPDAFTAVVVREAIDRHLAGDAGHSVVIVEPRLDNDFSLLADLLGALPHRAHWVGAQGSPRRERSVLLPAMRIPDRETADLVADWLTNVAPALRMPASEARLAVAAARAFAENALHHAPTGAEPSLLSVCRAHEPNDLQVVMMSPGVPSAAGNLTDEYLRDLVARSRSHLGGLSSLFTLARRRRLDVSLRVAVANGRVYGRTGGVNRVRYEPYPALMPAFVASLEIHIGSTIRPSG